jgi:N-acetylneuraminic acid mutarotase
MMGLRFKFIFIVALIILTTSCGGGGSSTATAPSISNLSYSPSSVYVGEGGGQTDIIGTFDFIDPDGNLNSVTIIVLDASGQTLQSETVDIADVAGSTSGTIEGNVTITTTTPGIFTVQIYVTDSSGLRSNTIEFIYRINEAPWVVKSAMPTKRLEFSSATLNGLIYIIGGRDATALITPKPVVSTVEIYNPATDTWTTGPSLPVACANQMTVTVNGKIYAIGGSGEALEIDVVQEFDPLTQKWTLKSNMPDERASAAVSVNNGLVYISGGKGAGFQLNSLLWYNPVADEWNAGSPMSQSREGSGAATINGQILVYGGYESNYILDAGYLKSVESYDPVMDTWSSKADGNPRRDFGVAVVNNLMYVFGGNNVARSLDWVNAYDNTVDQWMPKTPMPSSQSFVRAETIGDKIYIFDTNITFEYTPSNDIL